MAILAVLIIERLFEPNGYRLRISFERMIDGSLFTFIRYWINIFLGIALVSFLILSIVHQRKKIFSYWRHTKESSLHKDSHKKI